MFSHREALRGMDHPAGALASVEVENVTGGGGYVVVCEHASNFVPASYGSLGLGPEALASHIAWDPGALGVARVLAAALDAPLVRAGISRLVIDCNRDPAAVDAIPEISETTHVPGNANLSEDARIARVSQVYEPFHAAVADVVGRQAARGPVAVIGMHSFTPVYRGVARPWHIGILFDRDDSLARPMLQALRRDPALVVGANEPYSPGDRVYHTLDRHAQAHGRPSVMIEIRNDLLASATDQELWGRRLGKLFNDIGDRSA